MKKKLKKHVTSKTSSHCGHEKIGVSRQSKVSPRSLRGLKTLRFFEDDLDYQTAHRLSRKLVLSLDTETEGLDYRKHKLRLVQISTSDGRVYIVRNPRPGSVNLRLALLSPIPAKVFHHAMFDLRFIKAGIRIEVQGKIECTKTLMKIIHPEWTSGIGSALRHMVKVHLPSLKMDYSKWNEPELTNAQLTYCAADVLYLPKLIDRLKHDASWQNLHRYEQAMKVIPTKAFLEVEGYTDLFDYQQNAHATNLEQRNWWLNYPPLEFCVPGAHKKEIRNERI